VEKDVTVGIIEDDSKYGRVIRPNYKTDGYHKAESASSVTRREEVE
jgi:hypothetical protein